MEAAQKQAMQMLSDCPPKRVLEQNLLRKIVFQELQFLTSAVRTRMTYTTVLRQGTTSLWHAHYY